MKLKVFRHSPEAKLPHRAHPPPAGCGVEEVFEDTLNQGTARSEGGFGSTGDF